MNKLAYKIACDLLNIQAIKFNFETPYIWASDWKSPIYCDNRISLSHSDVRTNIKEAYVRVIQN